MNIKNYTSEVPTSRTLGRIQELLISAGVSQFTMEFDPFGKVGAVIFSIQTAPDKPAVPVRVPANVEACIDSLWKDYCGEDKTYQQQGSGQFRAMKIFQFANAVRGALHFTPCRTKRRLRKPLSGNPPQGAKPLQETSIRLLTQSWLNSQGVCDLPPPPVSPSRGGAQ